MVCNYAPHGTTCSNKLDGNLEVLATTHETSLESLVPSDLPKAVLREQWTDVKGSSAPQAACVQDTDENEVKEVVQGQGILDRLLGNLTTLWTNGVIWVLHSRRSSPFQDSRDWVDQRLRTPAVVAAMLPAAANPLAAPAAGPPSQRRLRALAVADVSFRGAPRRLWLLELEHPGADEPQSFQLLWLGLLLENATRAVRPRGGPWIWPLHDSGTSTAIMTASVRHLGRQPWWRHALWALRLLPLQEGCDKERQLAEHYGVTVSYVFACSNLYLRSLWFLTVPAVFISYALDARPRELGTLRGVPWHALQVWTLVWSVLVASVGQSRGHVLRGGGFHAVAAAAQRRADGKAAESPSATGSAACGTVSHPPKSLGREGASLDTAPARSPRCEAGHMQVQPQTARAVAARANFLNWPSWPGIASCLGSPESFGHLANLCWAPSGSDCRRESNRQDQTREVAAVRVQAAFRGFLSRKRARDERSAPRLAAHLAQMLEHRRATRQQNWSALQPSSQGSKLGRRALVCLFSAASILLFVLICVAVLLMYLQLNIYLTFIWGKCMDIEIMQQAILEGQECRAPEYIHGIWGWVAEVSSDIALALVFDICLGEVSKLLAKFLVRLQDYELLYDQRYALAMLSLLIEALSKVGMFAVVGFVYLPQWRLRPGESVATEEACQGLPDYELCKRAFGCDLQAEPDCCEGTLLCIARHFDFEHRRRLFERAGNGPFCVAPFVRILMTVIVPRVTRWLEEAVPADARRLTPCCQASHGAEGAERLRWTPLGCVKLCYLPVLRILALIFHLDADTVGAFGYLARGWPFSEADPKPELCRGAPGEVKSILEGALGQAARKPFEPFDELVELKMNFLFVSFLAPIMPFGLVPTLAARLLDVRSRAAKLFFVRRRCWPGEGRLLHATQRSFAHLAVYAAVVWHVGLILVVYNSELPHWGALKTVAIWGGTSVVLSALLHAVGRLLCRPCGADLDAA